MPTIIEGSGHRRKLEILGGVRCYLQKKQAGMPVTGRRF